MLRLAQGPGGRPDLTGPIYIVAGLIAWRRRPDNRVGLIMMAVGAMILLPWFILAPIGALGFTLAVLINDVSPVVGAPRVPGLPDRPRWTERPARAVAGERRSALRRWWGPRLEVIFRDYAAAKAAASARRTCSSSTPTQGRRTRSSTVLRACDARAGRRAGWWSFPGTSVASCDARREARARARCCGRAAGVARRSSRSPSPRPVRRGHEPLGSPGPPSTTIPVAFLVGLLRSGCAGSEVRVSFVELGGARWPAGCATSCPVPSAIPRWRLRTGCRTRALRRPRGNARRAARGAERACPLRALRRADRRADDDPCCIGDPELSSLGDRSPACAEELASAGRAPRAADDLAESRTRIVEAADAERRRIERNLHDGAQQRLLPMRLGLRLEARLGGDGATPLDAWSREVEGEPAEALDELRELGRGTHPPVLTERGLPGARDFRTSRRDPGRARRPTCRATGCPSRSRRRPTTSRRRRWPTSRGTPAPRGSIASGRAERPGRRSRCR